MKMRVCLTAIGLAGVAVAAGVAFAPQAMAKPDTIAVLSGQPGGSWFPINAAMAKIFSDNGVPSNAEQGGGVANVVRMSRREGELGMSHAVIPAIAREGKPPFKEKITNVYGAAALVENFQHVGVRKGTGVDTIADLKGRKFASQPIGNTTQYAFAQLLQAYGLTEDDLVLSRGSQTYGSNAVKDRNVVGFTAFTNKPTGTWSELFLTVDMKLLGISEEAFKKMKAMNAAYKLTKIPAGTYTGVDEDVPVIGTSTVAIVNSEQSADDVYWMVKTLAENLDELRQSHSAMKTVTLEIMADIPGFPMHEGATRYYREVGALK